MATTLEDVVVLTMLVADVVAEDALLLKLELEDEGALLLTSDVDAVTVVIVLDCEKPDVVEADVVVVKVCEVVELVFGRSMIEDEAVGIEVEVEVVGLTLLLDEVGVDEALILELDELVDDGGDDAWIRVLV